MSYWSIRAEGFSLSAIRQPASAHINLFPLGLQRRARHGTGHLQAALCGQMFSQGSIRMKARIFATLLVVGAAMAPIHAAEAGPLKDALSNKLGQAVFVGKVAKAKLKDAIGRRIKDVLFP